MSISTRMRGGVEIFENFGLLFPAKSCGPSTILPPSYVKFGHISQSFFLFLVQFSAIYVCKFSTTKPRFNSPSQFTFVLFFSSSQHSTFHGPCSLKSLFSRTFVILKAIREAKRCRERKEPDAIHPTRMKSFFFEIVKCAMPQKLFAPLKIPSYSLFFQQEATIDAGEPAKLISTVEKNPRMRIFFSLFLFESLLISSIALSCKFQQEYLMN